MVQFWLTSQLLILTLHVFSPASLAAGKSDKIVTMILADTQIRGTMEDANRFESMMTTGPKEYNNANPGAQLAYYPLPFKKFIDKMYTRNDLRESIGNLVIDGNTTVVFYYKGHGGVVHGATTGSFDHKLYLLGVDIPQYVVSRSELLEWLGERKPRLIVLITDTCSLSLTATGPPGKVAAFAPSSGLFEDLFLVPHGVADITAATFKPGGKPKTPAGEGAWSSEAGGLFSQAFAKLFKKEQERKVAQKLGTISWHVFFPKLVEMTRSDFVKFKSFEMTDPVEKALLDDFETSVLKDQDSQTPVAFSLPDP
jgi:hypothetical protein